MVYIGQIKLIEKLIDTLKLNYPESPLLVSPQKSFYRSFSEKKFSEKASAILEKQNEEDKEKGVCDALSLLLAHSIIYTGKSDWFWQQICKVMENNVDLENDKDIRLFFDNLMLLHAPDMFSSFSKADNISLAGLKEVSSLYTTISKLSELKLMFPPPNDDNTNIDSDLWIPGKTYLLKTSTHAMLFQYKGHGKYEFLDPNVLSLTHDGTFIAQEWDGEQIIELLSENYLENSSGPLIICALDKKDEVDNSFLSVQTEKFNTYFNAWLNTPSITKDINITGDTGLNLLHLAINYRKLAIAKELVEHGADVKQGDNAGVTSLHRVALSDDSAIAKLLLDHGASLTQVHHKGLNALQLAAINDSIEVMKTFITDYGADVKQVDENGITLLDMAAEQGCLNAVKVLINYEVPINKEEGITPLLMAAQNGHADVIKELLSHKAVVNQQTQGFSPLFMAAQNGHLDSVRILLAQGALINLADNNKRTPLFMAAAYGQTEVVKELLSHEVFINQPNDLGETPLLIAARYGRTEVVNELLAYNSAIDQADDLGRTPLLVAVLCHHVEVVKLLIDKGADIYKSDKQGFNPLFVAKHLRDKSFLKLLQAQDEKLTLESRSKSNHLVEIKKEDILLAVKKATSEYIEKPQPQTMRYSQFSIKEQSVNEKKTVSSLLNIIDKIEKKEEDIASLHENLKFCFENLSYEDGSLNFFLLKNLTSNELHNLSAIERKEIADNFIKINIPNSLKRKWES